ncbi:helix-turn-helix transcriptional regulator [Fusibacter sp. JL216-2]|uniref:helix-turn-helix transcriptional regulator n=1 Tax=Fusibacter sp. JL216-2 TaxID=3071453 RepID=UPI003D335F6A
MKKTERLNGIVYALKDRGKLTASELSELFEVSLRTIYRDIDALSQLKVPIITHEGVHGGYEIDMNYFMPSISLNEQEIIMLLIVLNYGETIRLPSLTADYQVLKGKVIHALKDVDQIKVKKLMKHIRFGSHRIEPTCYEPNILRPILDSFIDEFNLTMTYYNPQRDQERARKISPKNLFFEEGGWYLTAYCHLREEKRVFRLDRMKNVKIRYEKNAYLNRPISSATDKFSGAEYVMSIDLSLYRVLKDNDYFSDIHVLDNNKAHEAGYLPATSNSIFIKFFTRYEKDILSITLENPNLISIYEPTAFKDKVVKKASQLFNKYGPGACKITD